MQIGSECSCCELSFFKKKIDKIIFTYFFKKKKDDVCISMKESSIDAKVMEIFSHEILHIVPLIIDIRCCEWLLLGKNATLNSTFIFLQPPNFRWCSLCSQALQGRCQTYGSWDGQWYQNGIPENTHNCTMDGWKDKKSCYCQGQGYDNTYWLSRWDYG